MLKNFVKGGLYLVIGWSVCACNFFDSGGGGSSQPPAPGVISVNPGNGAYNVDPSVTVTATFTGSIDAATVDSSSFTMQDSSGNPVSGTVTYDSMTMVATFTPSFYLGLYRTYNATVSDAVTYSSGTMNISPSNWSFSTREGAWSGADVAEISATAVVTDPAPAIAVAPNGDAIAIWVTGSTVNANKYSAASTSWGTSQIISSLSNAKSDLRIAIDNNGNAMAVWSNASSGANTDLRARYYTATSNSWGTNATITTIDAGPGVANSSQVAFDASGNAIVVWLQSGDVYYNRYSGSAWAGANTIESGSGATFAPQLAVFANGDAIAVWSQYDGSTYNLINANIYTAGMGWGTEAPISTGADGAVPQVAVDGQGNAMALWLEGTGTYSAQAAYYTPLGGWEMQVLLENNVHAATTPQLGMDGAGNAFALWREEPTAGADRLRYSRYSGGSWGANGNLDDGLYDAFEPQLAVDEGGNAIVVWRETTDNSGSAGPASMWYRRYKANTSWSSPGLLETDDTYSISVPALGMSVNGFAFAAWIQNDSGSASVWGNGFE